MVHAIAGLYFVLSTRQHPTVQVVQQGNANSNASAQPA
jgi:hypothetical protein